MSTHCYHCHLPILLKKPLYFLEVDNVSQPMCCLGCKAVAHAIINGGLGGYYQHRTEYNSQASLVSDRLKEELKIYDQLEVQKEFVDIINNGQSKQARFLIEGITCAACVWLLEKHLGVLDTIKKVYVNLSTHELIITWNADEVLLSDILLRIYDIGYKAQPWHPDRQEMMFRNENRYFIRRLALSGVGAMQVMMYAIALYSGAISQDMNEQYKQFIRVISAIIATPIIFYSARIFFQSAIRDIRTGVLGMDVPVSVAIGGAFLASLWATLIGSGEVYFDSVSMFTFFLLTGRYLEFRVRRKTAKETYNLQKILPNSCLKRFDTQFVRVAISDLNVGDEVRILSGDSVPADGVIISGVSDFNESILTGENRSVRRSSDDEVIAGSINLDHSVEMRVTHLGSDTRLSHIARLVHHAQLKKPKIATMTDHVAGWFVGFVLLIALGVFSYWFVVDKSQAFWITLSVLVVTCPCALSLATPTALTAVTGVLHKIGFLVINGHVLEGLNSITHIVFDKTGTLTNGEFEIHSIEIVDSHYNEQEVLHLASTLESHSDHPIAKAFKMSEVAHQTSHIKNMTGQGIEGLIDGDCYRIGKPSFSLSQPISLPDENHLCLLLSKNDKPIAWFVLCNDSLRSDAIEVIGVLKKKYHITLLSGDRKTIVTKVADQLHIDDFYGETTPDDKLKFVQALQKKGKKVLMVGDGVNDIPVLAQSDVSIAMGHCSDLAKKNADALLLSNQLSHLIDTLKMVKKTKRVIIENIIWAIAYNVIVLPLAAIGWVYPWMAVIGMTGSSLFVVFNALRLSRMSNISH